MDSIIYKVLRSEEWAEALRGAPVEAPVDRADGYVHFSTAETLQDTLRKWFSGADGCMLAAFEAKSFGPALRWEPARGGVLFPHVYGRVRLADALGSWRLDMGPEGYPLAPDALPADLAGGSFPFAGDAP
jgi:uncharacterized protein (DUF952 family)